MPTPNGKQPIRLDQVDPASIEVVQPPPEHAAPKAAPSGAIRLDQIAPGDIEIVAPAPVEKSIAGKAYSWLTNDGLPDQQPTVNIGAKVPLFGSAGQFAAEHLKALGEYAVDKVSGKDHSYSAILDSIQKQREAVNAKFAKEHPYANTAIDVAAGLAAAPYLPVPGAVKSVLGTAVKGGAPLIGPAVPVLEGSGNALARIAGQGALSYADQALKTSDPDKALQGGTVASGLQAGIEALPYIGRPLAPLASAAAPAAKWAAGKVVSALGGVAPKNIEHYLENQGAVLAAGKQEPDAIKNLVDAELGKINYSVDEARLMHSAAQDNLATLNNTIKTQMQDTAAVLKSKVIQAKENLRTSFIGSVKRPLEQKTVPIESADEVVALLKNEKSVLVALSEQADDALARSGLTFQKDHLLSFIDHVGSSLGVGENNTLVGETAVKAAGSLASLRQRIADGMEDTISAPTLRGVLRQVRKDIDFDMGAAEFNDALNGARKAFTGKISDVLKDQIPEYAQIMSRMHTLSSGLEEMGKHFNTREQALASLTALASGKGPKAKIVEDVLGRYTDAIGKSDVVGRLGEYRAASQTLGNPLEMSALERGLPEYGQLTNARAALETFRNNRAQAIQSRLAASPEAQAVQGATDNLADAMTNARQYSGWSPASTESRLKSVASGRSIENAKTLDALSAQTNIDFKSMIKNRAVADAFEKGYMHGSRNVNLWAMIGSMFGGKALLGGEALVGGGAAVGGLIDQAGPKITQKLLDGFMFLRDSRFRPVLERAYANGPAAFMAQHQLLMRNEQYRKGIEGESK